MGQVIDEGFAHRGTPQGERSLHIYEEMRRWIGGNGHLYDSGILFTEHRERDFDARQMSFQFREIVLL